MRSADNNNSNRPEDHVMHPDRLLPLGELSPRQQAVSYSSHPIEIDRSSKAMKARLEVFENLRKLLEEDYELLGKKDFMEVLQDTELNQLYDKLAPFIRPYSKLVAYMNERIADLEQHVNAQYLGMTYEQYSNCKAQIATFREILQKIKEVQQQ